MTVAVDRQATKWELAKETESGQSAVRTRTTRHEEPGPDEKSQVQTEKFDGSGRLRLNRDVWWKRLRLKRLNRDVYEENSMWSVCGPDKMHSKNKVQTKKCRLTDRRKILLSGSPFGEQILTVAVGVRATDKVQTKKKISLAVRLTSRRTKRFSFSGWGTTWFGQSAPGWERKNNCPDEKKIVAVRLTNRPQLWKELGKKFQRNLPWKKWSIGIHRIRFYHLNNVRHFE